MNTEDLDHLETSTKVILVGIRTRGMPPEQAEEYMNELAFLARTAGADVADELIQQVDQPRAGTFVGTGKLEELQERLAEHNATGVIFDDELSPTQLRNIEKSLQVQVLDRTGLILQIFSEHARTSQAKAQVQLARMEYLLPRLRRMWTHLSRERGGIGMRGAGEQEIETDRRMIRKKITRLKEQLAKIDRQNQTRRKQRSQLVRVSLVGYTNVGKSTLMNLLTKADVGTDNKLFATLDTTVRKVVYDQTPFLLSDTVGFIRKLPHKLIESFKSTLDEVREADLLMHVIDIANPHYLEHMEIVRQTLGELDIHDKPVLLVFNKADRLNQAERDELARTWLYDERYPAVFTSALHKENIDKLRELLITMVKDRYRQKYPNLDPQQL